jgi:hypothetical protein
MPLDGGCAPSSGALGSAPLSCTAAAARVGSSGRRVQCSSNRCVARSDYVGVAISPWSGPRPWCSATGAFVDRPKSRQLSRVSPQLEHARADYDGRRCYGHAMHYYDGIWTAAELHMPGRSSRADRFEVAALAPGPDATVWIGQFSPFSGVGLVDSDGRFDN